MIKKLYSALYRDSGFPFSDLLKVDCEGVPTPNEITDKEAALIVWGGADISPSLYKHPESKRTWTGGSRDFKEWAMMQRAVQLGIPIIGVCRGAQMACAMAGGFLLQHVDGHAGSRHMVQTVEGKELQVNSLHHQMMVAPKEVDHELLAWSTEQRSKEYIYKDDKLFEIPELWKEPEFIYFPKIKAFAIQWHPEMMDANEAATEYVMEKINERTNSSLGF